MLVGLKLCVDEMDVEEQTEKAQQSIIKATNPNVI